MTNTVTVYTKPDCVQCDYTKKILKERHIPFTEVNVEEDHEAKDMLEELHIRQLPYIDSTHGRWTGFKIDRLRGLDPRDYV